jgi:hypothetical protein
MKIKKTSCLLFVQVTLLPCALLSQNVGIGTTSPSAKLEVAGGDAKINSITIGIGGGGILSNTAIGSNSLLGNTIGTDNTAVGAAAMYSNTVGYVNTGIGREALFSNVNGNFNVAAGRQALYSNINGIDNTAAGNQALFSNVSGSINCAFGDLALYHSKANYNTAFGGRALYFDSTGAGNIAVGGNALYYTNANFCTALGNWAGFANTTGSNNTFIGAYADVLTSSITNATAIGYNAKVGASNCLVLGGTGADAVNVGISTTTPAERLDINGAVKIGDGGYTGITANAVTPVPAGGAGTIVFTNTHFYGWTGTNWKQLDN